jgi:hypothetical protein
VCLHLDFSCPIFLSSLSHSCSLFLIQSIASFKSGFESTLPEYHTRFLNLIFLASHQSIVVVNVDIK